MPELSVEPMEPMHIEKIEVINADNAKLIFHDVYITGLCNYDVKFFHLDLEKQHFDVDIIFKRINMSMIYDVDASVIVHIVMKGPISITTGT